MTRSIVPTIAVLLTVAYQSCRDTVGTEMVVRIGHVAYWAGCIVGALLCLSAISVIAKEGPEGIVLAFAGAMIAGFGWAVRYVLSGRSDWRFDI